MKLYRIYTENRNRKCIESLVSDWFASYTVLIGTGEWKGELASTLIIEIIGESVELRYAQKLAHAIKKLNNLDAVLLTVTDIQTETI